MGDGDTYLLSKAKELLKARTEARPDFSKCGMGPEHAKLESECNTMLLSLMIIQLEKPQIETSSLTKAQIITWATAAATFIYAFIDTMRAFLPITEQAHK